MKNPAIRIGVTLGDPAGIGPEVALKAIKEITGLNYSPVIIGRYDILKNHYRKLLENYTIIDSESSIPEEIIPGKKYLLDIQCSTAIPVPGKGNPETGLESRTYIDKAVELWKRKYIQAIVTGPVNKSLIEKSGIKFTGHTEYIADLIGEKNPYMLMYSGNYRVLLVTSHIPLADVPRSITAKKILNTILAGNAFLNSINSRKKRIAITGLDPHCGDDGAIGKFDKTITRKAVKMALDKGIKIEGPVSADALLTPKMWQSYDMCIAHYHDQGLIPFKALAFDSGVNVTLGLSITRTSPDHGTAFDIAGKGKAGQSSMIEAIKMAYLLANKKSIA